jgi:hypothetical protein
MRVQKYALAGAAVLALALAGCSSESTEDANQAYCDAVATAQAEAAELRSLITGGGATVEDVQAQVDTIRDAAQEASDAAGSLSDSVRADIEAADEAFDSAIEAIPGDATLAQAAVQYQAAVSAWDAAVAQIRTEVGC